MLFVSFYLDCKVVNFNLNRDITSCVSSRKTKNPAGYDLFSAKNKIIIPCANGFNRLELCIAIPKGFYDIIVGRSSLTFKKTIVNNGVIASDYRGIVCVINVQYNGAFL